VQSIKGGAPPASLESLRVGRRDIGVVPATTERIRVGDHQPVSHPAVDLDLHRLVFVLRAPVANLYRRGRGSAVLHEKRLARLIRTQGLAGIDVFPRPHIVCLVGDVRHFGSEGAGQGPLVCHVPGAQLPIVMRIDQHVGLAGPTEANR
jgi:hypothetical protein